MSPHATTAAALLLLAGCSSLRPLEDARRPCEEADGEDDDGSCAPVHLPGIRDPSSPAFHGTLLRESAYDFDLCRSCHGEALDGGAAEVSCATCHEGGPTECGGCHALPPPTGAHLLHTDGGALEKTFACETCHVVPATWDAPGHVLASPGLVDLAPAEVVLSGLAAAGGATPTWDAGSRSCAGAFCHTPNPDDSEAVLPAPSWDAEPHGAGCATCHGVPPKVHSDAACATCHARVVDEALAFVDPSLHLNGAVEVGDGSGSCTSCHGGPEGPAPPADLSGETSPTARGVGAHESHLFAPHRLRGPLACGDCHLVPAEVASPGHLDDPWPAEVFPQAIAETSVAFAHGRKPTWNASKLSCAGTWCHGGPTEDEDLLDPDLVPEPIWTAAGTSGAISCGGCHGIPPAEEHDPGLKLFDCAGCHGASVDGFGKAILEGPPGAETSRHIDGVVDVEEEDE